MKKLITRSVFAACALTFSAGSMAAGFQLLEQSVVGLGRSHAGAGVVGDDLSAIMYNPAGMTLNSGLRVQQNFIVTTLDLDYKGLDGARENGRDTPALIPSGFISYQASDRLWFGLGITVPYGLKTRYDESWEGRERGISGSILTIDFNPTVAFKVNNWLSIGAGVSAMYTHSKLKNGINKEIPTGTALGNIPINGQFEYKGSDWMFTYDAGIMLTPVESVRLGISYRSAAKVNAKGDYTMRLNAPSLGASVSTTEYGYGRLETPETVMMSGTWQVTPSWRFSGLIRWSNWKNFDQMKFFVKDPNKFGQSLLGQLSPYLNQVDQLFPGMGSSIGSSLGMILPNLTNVGVTNNWKAAWLYTAGLDWDINEKWTIRGGIGLETDPIKNERNRTAVIPDTKRLWLSCGFSYKPTKDLQFDFAYAHLRGIGHDKIYASEKENSELIGHLEKANAYMFGAAMQYKF